MAMHENKGMRPIKNFKSRDFEKNKKLYKDFHIKNKEFL